MMYVETISDDLDYYKISRMGDMVWLTAGEEDLADNTSWLTELHDCLLNEPKHSKSEVLEQFDEMCYEHKIPEYDKLKIAMLLSHAKEKGWI